MQARPHSAHMLPVCFYFSLFSIHNNNTDIIFVDILVGARDGLL
jgi:hypothetical protein